MAALFRVSADLEVRHSVGGRLDCGADRGPADRCGAALGRSVPAAAADACGPPGVSDAALRGRVCLPVQSRPCRDRKSTRLNSSHVAISYAVFCLKKKK